MHRARLESSIAQDGTRVDKVRLSDRIKRIEMIGKHTDVRAFVERAEVTGKDGTPIEAVMVFNPVAGPTGASGRRVRGAPLPSHEVIFR